MMRMLKGISPVCLLVVCSFIAQVFPLSSTVYPMSRKEHVEVPENYGGSLPLYLKKVNLAVDGQANIQLVGNEEGLFGIEPESGILYVTRPLDREKQAFYTLQVIAKDEDEQPVSDPVTITITVKDENDNMPVLTEEVFSGILSKGTKQGTSFVHVSAIDLDDPSTPNANLQYKILTQTPRQPSENMFEINSRTGAVFLSAEGSSLLNSSEVSNYQLIVQVKDLGNQSLGYRALATVEITIVENTWIAPSPVLLQENLNVTYPKIISQVRWNSREVHYSLKKNFPQGLFSIDPAGNIYVTQELDRESQAEYEIQVFAENQDGMLYSDPLLLLLTVLDENDNMPVFTQDVYQVAIEENTAKGSEIITVKAEDIDDPNTNNAKIVYEILSQKPQASTGFSFHIGNETGIVTLQDSALNASAVKQYHLLVLVADLVGHEGGLNSTCTVFITILDVNDNPPVFSQTKYGPFPFPEDTEVGTLITTITATDEDEEKRFKSIVFAVESGNEDRTFRIVNEPPNGTVSIWLEQELDYETVQEYLLIVSARNEEKLVGKELDASSTATVHILVKDVNEAPVLTKKKYEVSILENVEPGTLLLTVKAADPDIFNAPSLSYSLRNDTLNWFSIDEYSGEVKVMKVLDRETVKDIYLMQVVVQDKASPSMTVSTDIVIHILDVNDNPPYLVGDYSASYLCTPQREKQSIIISAFDQDGAENSIPFSFSLANDPTHQRNWRINIINDTHAYLIMGISWLEPKLHLVPIILKDSGIPSQTQHVHLPVTICLCTTEGQCMQEVGRMEGRPTVLSAVSIIVGTIGAIGIFLLIIFVHLSLLGANKKKTNKACDMMPLQSTA
ncbi:cadherin-16 [Alligator mississippiensis]|uniref:Cadherin-16 isoform A n=1 Tax=Alligator mississippiensis TaxID=8496 RepID=A0A151N7A5_ALLMI|nr:cadherin-16 [Alligator mississippiensis]KYO32637.1 cadherin-16 isoform A [Alligator mississippiensis]